MSRHRVKITGASLQRPVLVAASAVILFALFAPALSGAQADGGPPQSAAPQPATDQQQKTVPIPPDPTIQNNIDAIESDESEEATRGFKHWNEFEGKYITARFGGGFLVDYSAFAQNQESKEQFSLYPDIKLRDFRFLISGRFRKFKRPITYSVGIMYDAPTHSWLIRQTGIMAQLSPKWGYVFIGRTKEGFSLNKVMTGYDGWTMERSPMNDATVPLLADGIKWLGYSPKHGFGWNLGMYDDLLCKGQTFCSYAWQAVARPMWLPIRAVSETHSLLHVAINLQYGKPVDNQFRLRSRPENFIAPYFVDTGTFPATAAFLGGPEIYYRRHSWLFGSEDWIDKISSPTTGNPLFYGGDFVATWIITGEIRTYNTVGGFFRAVLPQRPVFNGGPGAWELVSHYSYINLNSGTVHGGKFGRFTEQLNWYLSQYVRLEFAYGYGHLDSFKLGGTFGLSGNTQFFQGRIQLQL